MKKLHMSAMALALTTFAAGAAQAEDNFGGKKGLSVSTGGASTGTGLAFDYGLANMAIEAGLGVNAFMPKDGDTVKTILFNAGVHYNALHASQAAFTAGGRLRLGMDKAGEEDRTSIAIDIPMRVYWFPITNFSLHAETGIAIKMVGEFGSVFAPGLTEGKALDILTPIGGMGATFWW
ncbi:MAG: hypothetical protein EXR76_13375 [Myxococcales bacterium]|nr:hypothetical protein [Myxococcales bacterium]